MNVLVTGAYGRCGTALIDHLHDRDGYNFTYYNRSDRPDNHPYGGYDTIVGNITDAVKLQAASEKQDAMVHMAAYPSPTGDWGDIFEPNIIGMYNALEVARKEEIKSVVFLSSNHVVGKYESEHAPDLYGRDYSLVVDHRDPVRPDSYYGVSKSFGEDLGRYYVETYEYPQRFYSLRTGTVNMPKYDHPYGDAESAVDNDNFEQGSSEYEQEVARMKCTWQSRRDFAHQVDCCLIDSSVEYGVFFGVSNNRRRWFDLEHARSQINYDPQDDGEEWDGPPS
ncbi:NAD(P)-dependent oxidoreductase [Halalkalicoccus tibetensis]|uniref:NAD-dependent epimerase/dehydratase family protein n=1 Tax=Halalkalicoccus tibetensis TaxID=175632 RepID=A0ABD5V6Y8_9EURY